MNSAAQTLDLRAWISTDMASVRQRFEAGIAGRVPAELWKTRISADSGTSSSIAGLLLHLAYHQDLAIQTAVLGREPLLARHRAAVGLVDFAPHVGLSESEDHTAVDALDVDALRRYANDVFDATARWFGRVGTNALITVPPACRRLTTKADVTESAVPWLHAMWHGKPTAWFVQWEVIGHGHTHVGEMTALRNQMGLSPF